MKKLLVAALVLVSAIVCHANPISDIAEYYDGVFKITQNGSITLTYYSPDTKYGQVVQEFGYIKLNESPTEWYTLDKKLKGGESVTLSDLQAGDEIVLYIKKTHHNGTTMIYSADVTLPDSMTNFHETEYGYTFGDSKWEDGRVLGFTATSTPDEEPTPSGQPLPGALTTMLIAGGCAAYLKRKNKKAARK